MELARKTLAIGGALALVLVMGACSNGSTTTTPSAAPVAEPSADSGGDAGGGTITIDGQEANDHGTEDASGMDEFEMEADTDDGQDYFKPTTLQGSPGQELTLELVNESTDVEHNFTLEDQQIDEDLEPGASTTVTVTFPEEGTLQFHCEFHEGAGMIGQLEAV